MSECDPVKISERIISLFPGNFPEGRRSSDPFQILISTVLSQRTRDENTFAASKALFSRYPDCDSLSGVTADDIKYLIRPAGMFNQKAKNIISISKIIKEKYGGVVPEKLEQLLELPGVGRKTANIVLFAGFGVPALAVDTHVHRISNRLGWIKTKNPEESEFELMKVLPENLWGPVNVSMVDFGRNICRPQRPLCEKCEFTSCCDFFRM